MSEEQRYTPGPWHWDSDPIKGDPLGRVRYRVTAKGKTITQCYYASDDPHAEYDARLIASAPTLRDERDRLRSVCINMQSAWNNKNETTSLHVWHERMKAAMADVEAALTPPEQEGGGR